MAFEIQYSKALPTTSPGAAKANYSVDQGYQDLAKGIESFGNVIYEIGMDQKKAGDTAALSSLTRQNSDEYGKLESQTTGGWSAATNDEMLKDAKDIGRNASYGNVDF